MKRFVVERGNRRRRQQHSKKCARSSTTITLDSTISYLGRSLNNRSMFLVLLQRIRRRCHRRTQWTRRRTRIQSFTLEATIDLYRIVDSRAPYSTQWLTWSCWSIEKHNKAQQRTSRSFENDGSMRWLTVLTDWKRSWSFESRTKQTRIGVTTVWCNGMYRGSVRYGFSAKPLKRVSSYCMNCFLIRLRNVLLVMICVYDRSFWCYYRMRWNLRQRQHCNRVLSSFELFSSKIQPILQTWLFISRYKIKKEEIVQGVFSSQR